MKDKKINYKKLKDSREGKNITQKEMASKLNIEQSTYSLIENGKRGLRVEQLAVIAEILEKNIDDLLIESKENKNLSSLEVLKNENAFLMSMISLLSTTAEDELFSLIHSYDNQLPTYQVSFEEYLSGGLCKPEHVVSQIKSDIEDYENEFITYPIYDEWSDEGIKLFIGKDDEWLLNFVKKEENYDLVWVLLDHPSYIKTEDSFKAFKDMLKENHLIHKLFQYGFFEKSSFSYLWEMYLEEMKSTLTGDGFWPNQKFPFVRENGNINFKHEDTFDVVASTKRREERERMREKMKSILKDGK